MNYIIMCWTEYQMMVSCIAVGIGLFLYITAQNGLPWTICFSWLCTFVEFDPNGKMLELIIILVNKPCNSYVANVWIIFFLSLSSVVKALIPFRFLNLLWLSSRLITLTCIGIILVNLFKFISISYLASTGCHNTNSRQIFFSPLCNRPRINIMLYLRIILHVLT